MHGGIEVSSSGRICRWLRKSVWFSEDRVMLRRMALGSSVG